MADRLGANGLTHGRTAPITEQLLIGGAAFNATGFTPELVLKDVFGNVVDTANDVTWEDAAVSKIKYTPDAADLDSTKSPYLAHWKVTSGSGIDFFPEGRAAIWEVHPQ